jgi:parallel beta-helix repeat protein
MLQSRFCFGAATCTTVLLTLAFLPAHVTAQGTGAEIHIGIDDGELRGNDHRALQAAVDYVSRLGGGTVWVGPGRYRMRNALILRDKVQVRGVPGKTILAAEDGAKSLLAADGDCYERQVTLADPSGFQVGDGVAIWDDHGRDGFEVTTATLTARVDERTFRISAPLYLDYMVRLKATAARVFPVVGGWRVKDVLVEGITVDGNAAHNEFLDGCRGGGIYLFECENITLRNCAVRNYHGDGISFQVSHHVTVEDCLCENNTGLGIHPGSGSQHPVVRHNRALNNGRDGLYVCWRVKHGLFEDNELRGNHDAGVSIGHKDTDNIFRTNTIEENGKVGVLFREESEPMGAHRNVFEGNRILDNGSRQKDKSTGACVLILGHHHDVVFRNNTIGSTKTGGCAVGILAAEDSKGLQAADNNFLNLLTKVKQR